MISRGHLHQKNGDGFGDRVTAISMSSFQLTFAMCGVCLTIVAGCTGDPSRFKCDPATGADCPDADGGTGGSQGTGGGDIFATGGGSGQGGGGEIGTGGGSATGGGASTGGGIAAGGGMGGGSTGTGGGNGTGGGLGGGSTGGGMGGGGSSTGGGTGGSPDGGFVGESCGDAPLMVPGLYSGLTTVGGRNDLSPVTNAAGCSGAMPGPDRVWVIDVKAGQRLEARLAPTVASPVYNASLYLVENCAAQVQACLASSNSAGGGAERTAWTNKSSGTKRVFVIADSTAATPSASETNAGQFDLSLQLYDGDICSNPEVLIAPFSVPLNNDRMADDYTAPDAGDTCGMTDDKDLVIAVDIPSGKRATIKTSGASAYYSMALLSSAAEGHDNLLGRQSRGVSCQ